MQCIDRFVLSSSAYSALSAFQNLYVATRWCHGELPEVPADFGKYHSILQFGCKNRQEQGEVMIRV